MTGLELFLAGIIIGFVVSLILTGGSGHQTHHYH